MTYDMPQYDIWCFLPTSDLSMKSESLQPSVVCFQIPASQKRTGWRPDMHGLYPCDPKPPEWFYQLRLTPGSTDQMLGAGGTLLTGAACIQSVSAHLGSLALHQIPRASPKLETVLGKAKYENLPADRSPETGRCMTQRVLRSRYLAQHYLGHSYIFEICFSIFIQLFT